MYHIVSCFRLFQVTYSYTSARRKQGLIISKLSGSSIDTHMDEIDDHGGVANGGVGGGKEHQDMLTQLMVLEEGGGGLHHSTYLYLDISKCT